MDEGVFARSVAADREATMARIASLRVEIDGIVAASNDGNGDDEHEPEGSTVAFERARASALLADAEGRLRELDRAAARLDSETYAVCEQCGGPIAPDRLAARPGAVACIRCAAAPKVR